LRSRRVSKIPPDLFRRIEKHLPFSSVDIVIFFGQDIILTKRKIRPYQGYWHLPGSIVLKNEKMIDTVRRSAKEELGIRVDGIRHVGNYELFTANRHYITHLYSAQHKSGTIRQDHQSSEYILTKPKEIPTKTIPIQKVMIKDALCGA
jgi:ADP-ribose pyrophosphatase YjhB (NUDIX family)